MNAPTTRWAMIGTGAMAVNIVRDFQLTENVELTTVVSRSPEKGAKFAAEWGIPNVVTDLAALWADPDIDVVYIATPHPAHFAAAKAGWGLPDGGDVDAVQPGDPEGSPAGRDGCH